MHLPPAARFWSNRSGATVVMFAILLVPIIMMVGAAIDYNVGKREQARLQESLDNAVLAALGRASAATNAAEAQAIVEAYLNATYGGAYEITSFEAALSKTATERSINATAVSSVPTSFLAIARIDSIDVAAHSETRVGNDNLEIVMVLDNSGSMSSNSRIARLKDAAKALVTTVNDVATGKVKYGLVPFAGLVNVGPGNKTKPWIDTAAASSIHSENFDKKTGRLSLYAQTGIAWRGCVEARPNGLDITDEEPLPAKGDTLFVPSFGPDEPDVGSGFINNYLKDDGGACTTAFGASTSLETRQEATCKYHGTSPAETISNGTHKGPNHLCDSAPILPLTDNAASVTAAIDAMVALGGTDITEGMAWGWRVISPTEPFTEGQAYTTMGLRKIIVLMTDGANTMYPSGNMNLTWYSAYGFAAAGRLGTATGDAAILKAEIDSRLAKVCTHAKAAGIEVYTITYDVADQATRDLMLACATDTSHAYFPTATDNLVAVFEAIGHSVGKLRLSE